MKTSATGSSEVATTLGDPDFDRQSLDSQVVPRAVAAPVPDFLHNHSRALADEAYTPELDLQAALHGLRGQLARSWSFDTAYPGSLTESHWFPGNPQGQCGVSSVWLAEVLAREYSIASIFCRGSLVFDGENTEDLSDHCWLEINGRPGDGLILDLTCDQARGFDRQIVFDAKARLESDGVHYISSERVATSDLPSNPVWPRYMRLLFNMVALVQ
jgi:hypothetical protein